MITGSEPHRAHIFQNGGQPTLFENINNLKGRLWMSITMAEQKQANQTDTGRDFLCVATFLPIQRWRNVIPFLRMTSRVRKQLKSTEGLLRYTVKADFLHKRFWTFSVWSDRATLAAFVKTEPHATAVQKFRDWAAEGAAFVEWNSTDELASWDEALGRLQNPTFYYSFQGK